MGGREKIFFSCLGHSLQFLGSTREKWNNLFLELNQGVHFSATSKQFLAKRLRDLLGNKATRNSQWLKGCHHNSECEEILALLEIRKRLWQVLVGAVETPLWSLELGI